MGGLANEAETDAGRLGAFDGDRRRLHRRHRSKTVPAVEHERRGAIVDEARPGLRIDLAALDDFQIARQARYAVTVDAAQVGPDQSLGDDRGVRRVRAMGDQHVADEAPELLVSDDDFIRRHGSLTHPINLSSPRKRRIQSS